MMNRCRSRWIAVTVGLIVLGSLNLPPSWGQSENASAGQVTSALWGESGELWTPQSRLPDFSYAGYHRGEAPLPERAVDVSVKDFGAVGDGKADDTEAFQKAIDASPGKVIGVPSGRYRITNIIRIATSGTVLKGEDPKRSILFVPLALETIRTGEDASTPGAAPSRRYSSSGGIVEVQGSLRGEQLATVREPAERGGTVLALDSTARLRVGDEVRILQQDPGDKSLVSHLYAGDEGNISDVKARRIRATFVARVTSVDPGARRIEIDRPLRTDVRPEWSARLQAAKGTVEEVGIERLGFEFPATPYKGHFTEWGFNPVAMSDVRNCYLRDLEFHNHDVGPVIRGESITLSGLRYESSREADPRDHCKGHHGVILYASDVLMENFTINTTLIHDVTVSSGGFGNVVSSGRAVNLSLDHHCKANHANLWTDLDAGEGTRLWISGGNADEGRHSGAWETFWNIRARTPLSWPRFERRTEWGPDLMNLVGLTTNDPSILNPSGRWFESIPPARLSPANLYKAQLANRRGNATRQNSGAR